MQVERPSLLGSGKRVSNTLVTYLEVWDNFVKTKLIPNGSRKGKDLSLQEGPTHYQLVGEVMAHQGYDG